MATASFKSFPEMFLHRVSSTPDSDAFYYPDLKGDGEWKTLLWKDVGDQVQNIAGGLRALGLESEERVSIFSGTRVEWIICDLGILCAAGATTTIYPSSTAEEASFIIVDSESVVVIAEDNDQVDKLVGVRADLPLVHHVIVIDGSSGHDGWVISLADLIAQGKAWNNENPGRYEEIARAVESHHLATLIYTSGTTGKPKGVKLDQAAWVFEGEAMDAIGFLSPADKQFLWLPLAHSFGKVLEAAIIRIGVPTAIDGRIPEIVNNLAVVKPTFMGAVPRIFEKVYNKVVTGAKEAGGLKWRIFQWSLGVGRQVSQLKQKGIQPSGLMGLKFAIADKLVFSKLKERFGGRLRFFISGGAPLARELAEFFHAADILILEGYGLTESSAASFVNRPDKFKFGTVGMPLPGVELKIDEGNGEILIHSPGVMQGYHNRAEATAETLTEDHWLRTGDVGVVDADGFLKITDRIKDLIKTSGGKYVAPQELENQLKPKHPLIGQVLVHGNNRNFCVALITLNSEYTEEWAEKNDKAGMTYLQLTQDDDVKAIIQGCVDQLNATRASYETLKYFSLLPKDLSQEEGDLTPSLKVKRKVVETKYKDILDGFYTGSVAEM